MAFELKPVCRLLFKPQWNFGKKEKKFSFQIVRPINSEILHFFVFSNANHKNLWFFLFINEWFGDSKKSFVQIEKTLAAAVKQTNRHQTAQREKKNNDHPVNYINNTR